MQVFNISGPDFQSNPLPQLRQMREAGPIVGVKLPIFGTLKALTRYADVDPFLRDHELFTRDGSRAGKRGVAGLRWWMPKTLKTLANNMLTVDEPDHRRLRGLVEQAFARRSIESMRASLFEMADRLIDECHRQSKASGMVDFLGIFCRQFPLAVICELLGLPDSDRPKFTRWFSGFANIRSVFSGLSAVPGMVKARRYLESRISHCRHHPEPGLITELVQAEQDGARLSDQELLAMVFLLLAAGHETTTHLIADGLLTLLDHESEKQRLMNDWSLADSAIDEMLRYASPVQLTKPRYVSRDTELHNVFLRRGSLVIGMLACANHDPEQFDSPDRFDITRSPNRHLSFGRGIHVCLGLKLAKAEAAIALERLLTRYPETRLAVSRESIRWRRRIGIRQLEELPLKLAN